MENILRYDAFAALIFEGEELPPRWPCILTFICGEEGDDVKLQVSPPLGFDVPAPGGDCTIKFFEAPTGDGWIYETEHGPLGEGLTILMKGSEE